MKNNKMLISVVMVLVVTWIVAYIFEPKLPEQVPTHWNSQGEVNGYTSKPWGVYMIPIVSTFTSLLLYVLAKVSPKGFKLKAAETVYELLILIIAIFMLGVMVLTFQAALDESIDINQWIMVGIGALFIVIGNYLTKVPKNFFIGIRTPWTLASDKVWFKTHRVASWTFVIAGMLTLLGGFFAWSMTWMTGVLVSVVLIPILYSLWAYKQIEGFEERS